ncbi:MAG: glycosyltransferase family 2 protein [Frankiaceae bacterium]|nr:glycosyltransferase family 2 protein [Frankiaceae bacterium]
MPPRTRAPKAGPAGLTVDVTAVLVSCDGARWLPDVLAALAASTAQPARVVCVDAGSTDGSEALLEAAYGDVLQLPRGTGFGAAVAAGLQGAPESEWVWLLHDDAAPEPDALAALLTYAQESSSAALLGPKARDWDDPRVLVEVGLTTDAAGHRETGLDRHEYDQGQHDAIRDVLAVGTAGALIRRDVWSLLGGLDPDLPVFRDDLDLGWRVNAAGHRVVVVPSARIRHARAATTGRRELPAATGRPAGIDRRNALFVLLAHAAGPRLLLALPRLVLAGLLRALGYLLTRQVVTARDELAALLHVLTRPGRLLRARRARARTRVVPPRALRHLLAKRSGRARARLEALGDWLSGGAPPGTSPMGALGDPGPEGPDELADLAPPGGGTLRRLLWRPGVVLAAALALLALVAERSLLPPHGGALLGGRLLPVPSGARSLWASYVGAWHPTAVGSAADAHPSTGVLAVLSTLLLGKPWLVVDLLLLLGVAVAGAVAYVAAGRITAHRVLRIWAAATWALLPVATGAVAAGRLDAIAVQVALPALLVAGARLLRRDQRGWRRAWGLGLALAVTAAFAPILWPLLGGLLVAGAVLTRSLRRIGAALVAAVVPAAVLLPWSFGAIADPSRLLDGPGRLVGVDAVPAWHLVLLHPGGPADPATWITAGLLLAGLGGLLRRDAHRLALAGWAVALVAMAVAVLLERGGHWPGVALQVAAAGVLTSALVGANGLRTRLAQNDFGSRQLTAAVVAVAAALTPVAAAGSWVVRGADDPVRRGTPAVLPAFVRAELRASPGVRVLVVRAVDAGVSYELAAAGTGRLGSADTSPTDEQVRRLDAVVADLLAARGSDAAEALSTRAVRYVALPAGPGSARLAAALDVQAGLSRRASGRTLLWRVVAPTSRLVVLRPAPAAAALRGARGPTRELLRVAPPLPLTAGREAAATNLPAGPPGRLLVLAEATSRGWNASVDGTPLEKRTAWGWAQGFVLPPQGGRLEVSYDQTRRHLALAGQAVAVAIVLVLSAPAARRRRGLEVVDDEEPT